MTLVLGIDFEHIHHTPAYRSLDDPPEIPIDFETITRRLLDLLDRNNSRATFFVVAEFAEQYPQLIREIANSGHEIASHTVTHPSLPSQETEDKRIEIRESKEILEDLIEQEITGFRAPTFQLDDETYTLLTESGYQYSSSVVSSLPIPGFYSNTYNFEEATTVQTQDGALVEQPVAVNPWIQLPASGAWTRLFGRTYFLKTVQTLLKRDAPVLTYVHPWEFTSLWGTPLPFRNRFRTGEWLFETYEQLLADHRSVTVSEFLAEVRPTAEYSVF